MLPWLTVEQTVAFGLRYVALDKDEREERITSLLKLARMEEFRHAYPKQLSGGLNGVQRSSWESRRCLTC